MPADSDPRDAEVDLGFAKLDMGRKERRGFAEAIFCAGKTIEQVVAIAEVHRDLGRQALFTRVPSEQVEPIRAVLVDARVDSAAGLIVWPPEPPEASGRSVAVLAAGTSDLRVAREAMLTSTYLGRKSELIIDIGVAGLHRLLRRVEEIREAGCVVVAAGMDGALPSVVAGLVAVPVVAVPTSVGYGTALGGIAPLLSMLNACSPGVAVVNIDNGFGAGYLAAQITAPEGFSV